MQIISQAFFEQWLLQPTLIFFLVIGVLGVIVGAWLVFNGAKAFQFFGVANSWVSLRHVTKSMDIPRNIAPDMLTFLQRYRRFFAVFVVLSAGYVIYSLIVSVDILAAANWAANEWQISSAFTYWIADSIRWSLVVGSILAIVVGVMLEFCPKALLALEKNSAKWWTSRKISKRTDAMNLSLDKWAEGNPKQAGWIILGISLMDIFAVAASLV